MGVRGMEHILFVENDLSGEQFCWDRNYSKRVSRTCSATEPPQK